MKYTVSVDVPELDAGIRFYGEAFGFVEARRPEEESDRPKMDEDPEKAMEKAAKAMEILGRLMGEMSKFRIAANVTVPGEVVSFVPKEHAKVDGSTVTWEYDMSAMMSGVISEDSPESSFDGIRVTFRMPEGKELPAHALSTNPDLTETPAEPPEEK